ncbi:hypothetical protein ACQV5M_19655, partial [Leptospira sp. SA-E8]|uniref:hypothetical protein n=1 Tax=Leptospira sp. SA-E8 TaxID=3422259 RepID=UPI003EBB2A2B
IALIPALFFLISLIWVWPIGGGGEARLLLALMDMQSLILLPIVMMVFWVNRNLHEWFRQFMRFTIVLIAALALVQVLIWILIRYFPISNEFIYQYVDLFFGTREGVNILGQPSNEGEYFRVVWISSYWLLFSIFMAPIFIKSGIFLFLMQITMGIAVIASYTRGIWLGLILGMMALAAGMAFLFYKNKEKANLHALRISLFGVIAAILLVGVMDLLQGNPRLLLARFYISTDTRNANPVPDESARERLIQSHFSTKRWD